MTEPGRRPGATGADSRDGRSPDADHARDAAPSEARDSERPADQQPVDLDSAGVYYMSVEDFERRREPGPGTADDRRGR